MTVVSLRQPRLVVRDLVAGAAIRRGLHEESHDHADDAVDEQHEAQEHMNSAGYAHEAAPEREVDAEARDDQEDHRNKVDPVRDDEGHRMRFAVMCQVRHVTSPPKGS